jgi:hypothetical protein
MAFILQHFRQSQVVTEGRLWPRVHRRAETRAAGLAAVDCHDEEVLPPGLVNWVNELPAEKNLVLDRDGVQFA